MQCCGGWLLTINKIQQIQTFLKQMDKPRSLDALLKSHDIPAEEFFQTLGIAQQIRNNLTRFIRYCRSHRTFARRMITLALNVPASDLEQDPALRTASHAITEVLSNEEPALAELFFEEQPTPTPEGSDIPEELQGGIQSEAERLLNFSDEQEEPQQQRPVEVQPLELAELSLEILHEPQRNPTCLGHLHKLYSFLIRHNPLPVLNYFKEHPQALQMLLGNLRYSSVSSLVAQLLTSEDKTRVYAHEGLKRRIIQFSLQELFAKIQDEEFFDGVMILVEEILNTTKQSYYEYFEDFKRVSNILVSSNTLGRFLQILLALREPSFRSAARFLEFLFVRINSEREDNSYYHRGEETEPSMNFEVEIFFQKLPGLVGLVPQINAFNSITKIHYLSFLDALLIAAQVKNYSFSLSNPAFIGLFDCLNRQKKGGLFKNKLYNLITAIISRATAEQATQFLETHGQVWEEYFAALRAANYINTKTYNKNESSAFDLSLINQLAKKNNTVIAAAGKATGKDIARMCKKYETKIGNVQTNSAFVLEEESNFMQFSVQISNIQFDNRTQGSNSNQPAFSLNFVGKNSISIPILTIPDRYYSSLLEDKERGERDVPHINGINQIVQIEEVVSLTDTIKTLTIHDREDCHIDRPPELSRNQKELDSPQRQPKKETTISISQLPILKPVEVNDRGENGVSPATKLKEKSDHLEQARFFAKYLPIFA